jgi:hypothetical protein
MSDLYAIAGPVFDYAVTLGGESNRHGNVAGNHIVGMIEVITTFLAGVRGASVPPESQRKLVEFYEVAVGERIRVARDIGWTGDGVIHRLPVLECIAEVAQYVYEAVGSGGTVTPRVLADATLRMTDNNPDCKIPPGIIDKRVLESKGILTRQCIVLAEYIGTLIDRGEV